MKATPIKRTTPATRCVMELSAVIGHLNEAKSPMPTLIGRELCFTDIYSTYNWELFARSANLDPENLPKRRHNSEFTLKKQTTMPQKSRCTGLYKLLPFCFDSRLSGEDMPSHIAKASAALIRKLENLIPKHHDTVDH